jgi:hypothetical protein
MQFWFRAEDLKRRLVQAMRDGFEEVLSRYMSVASVDISAMQNTEVYVPMGVKDCLSYIRLLMAGASQQVAIRQLLATC